MPANQSSFLIKLLGDSKGAVTAVSKANAALAKQKGLMTQVTAGATKLSKTLKSGTDKIQANAVTIAGGAFAAKKAFDATIGVAANFESAILKVKAVSGGAVEELEELARAAGKATVFSATEAADALLLLAQAGLDAKESQDTLIPTLNLAAAAQIDLATATDMVVSNLTVFQEGTDQASRFADTMAKTTSVANTNMEQLGAALEFVGPVASQVGMSFENVNAMIAAMATQGIKGEKAGTQLRAALTNIIKPTAAAERELARFNITTADIKNVLDDPVKLFKLLGPVAEDTAASVQIFGKRNLAVASAIKNATPQLIEFTKEIKNAGGTAQTMADTQISGLQGQAKLLKSAFEELVISGSKDGGLLDIFTTLTKVLTGAVRGLQAVPAPLKAVGIGIAVLTPAVLALNAALGPMGLALTAVSLAVPAVIGAFGAWKKSIDETLPMANASIVKTSELATEIDALAVSVLNAKRNPMDFEVTIEGAENIPDLNTQILMMQKRIDDLKRKLSDPTQIFLAGAREEMEEEVKQATAAMQKLLNARDRLRFKETAAQQEEQERRVQLSKENAQELFNFTASAQEKELAALNQQYSKIQSMEDLSADQRATAFEAYYQKRQEIIDKNQAKEQSKFEKAVGRLNGFVGKAAGALQQVTNAASGTLNAAMNAITQKFENEQLKQTESFKAAQQSQHAALQEKFDQGLITEQEFNESKEAIDNEFAIKQEAAEKEIRIKQAKAARKAAGFQKGIDIANAIARTALAVVTTLTMPIPRSVAIPLASVVGALGAAQTAIIAATPLPEVPSFQKGGIKMREGLAMVAEGNRPEAILPAELTAFLMAAAKRAMGGAEGITIGSLVLPNVTNFESFIENLKRFIETGGKIPSRAIA